MRVTNRMLVETVVRNLQHNLDALNQIQNQVSSGKRVTRPSDDPEAAALGVRLRHEKATGDQFLRNVEQARSWLTASDQALGDIGDALSRIRELAIQAANGTYTASDRAAIGQEVDQLRRHIIATLNDAVLVDQRLFAGAKTTAAAVFTLDANGNAVYNGATGVDLTGATDLVPAKGIEGITLSATDSATPATYRVTVSAASGGVANVQIDQYDSTSALVRSETQAVTVPAAGVIGVVEFSTLGLTMTVNSSLGATPITGTSTSTTNAFTTSATSLNREVGPGTNLPVNVMGSSFLPMLADLQALATNLSSSAPSQTAIEQSIGAIDKAIDVVLKNRAEVGAKVNRLDFTQSRMSALQLEVQRLQSTNEDVDFAEALTRLTTQQAVYQASLQAGARTVPMSILDFLH